MRGVGYLHANCICLPLTESELCHVSCCGRFQTPPPPSGALCDGLSWALMGRVPAPSLDL